MFAALARNVASQTDQSGATQAVDRPDRAGGAERSARLVAGHDPLRRAIRDLDARLRRSDGIIEFSDRADCVLRVGLVVCERRLILSDGAVIERGEPVAALHFWNEHLSQIDGRGIVWGAKVGRGLVRSMSDLASAMSTDPRLREAKAVMASMASGWRGRPAAVDRFAAHFGFETIADDAPDLRRWAHDLAEDLWLWGLAWAFSPQTLAHRDVLRRHDNIWISRARFVARFRRD